MSELVAARVRESATRLGLTHLSANLSELLARADTDQLGYLELLDLVTGEETAAKDNRRYHHALKLAGLPHHKTLDEFVFSFQPDLDVRKVRDLATLAFIETHTNVALLGSHRVANLARYAMDVTERRITNPIQTIKDVLGGTILLEHEVAVANILVGGAEIYRGGDYCGREAECLAEAWAPPGSDAITLGHTISFSDPGAPGDALVGHEMQHVYDIESVGARNFYLSYGIEYVERRRRGQGHDEAYENLYWEQRGYYVQDNYNKGVRPRGWPAHTRHPLLAPLRWLMGA